MTVDEWCRSAQEDQNTHGASHLYGNYRHSIGQRLLPPTAIDNFDDALLQAISDGSVFDRSMIGMSDYAVEEANKAQYRRVPLPPDFRIAGPQINASSGEIMVNVSVLPERTSSTGRGAIGAVRPSRPRRLKWLTIRDAAFRSLSDAHTASGSLDALAVFRELVAVLGLRAADDDPDETGTYECRVNLYRLRVGNEMHRPHALSGGYANRFCGTSPVRPYGSTADNRTGRGGVPEAIAFAEDIELIDPSHTDYVSFRSTLGTISSWVSSLTGAIEAWLPGPLLFAGRMAYPDLQRIVLRRLRERREPCGLPQSICLCLGRVSGHA